MTSVAQQFEAENFSELVEVVKPIEKILAHRNYTKRSFLEDNLRIFALPERNTALSLRISNHDQTWHTNNCRLLVYSHAERCRTARVIRRKHPGTTSLRRQRLGTLDILKGYTGVAKAVRMTKISRCISNSDACHISRGYPKVGGGWSGGENGSSETNCSTISHGPQSTLGKRRSRPNDNDGDGSEGENGKGTKRSKQPVGELDSLRVRFACPYRKRDPQTYAILGKHTRCAIAQLKSVSRVKEHLFRCHLAPIHCPRCWCEFEAERDLENHLQAEDICHKRNSGDPPRGITAEQARVLRSRKKSPVAQSEEQRWMEIYQLLFPNEPCPDSPYFEEVPDEVRQPGLIDANDYSDYVQRESPNVFRSQLAQLTRDSQALTREDWLWIFQQCQATLLMKYNLQATGPGVNTDTEPRGCRPMGHDISSTALNTTSDPAISSYVSEDISLTNTDYHPLIFPDNTSNGEPELSLNATLLPESSLPSLSESNINRGIIETGTDMNHDAWRYLEWA